MEAHLPGVDDLLSGVCAIRLMTLKRVFRQGNGQPVFETDGEPAMAELLARQAGPQPARQVLEPVYRGFTEGFDTPDLRQAKTLLDELAASSG